MTDFYRQPDEPQAPLILTAMMEESAAQRFDAMRRAYFPPERNRIQAHLTMFHALPGSALAEIEDELAERSWQLEPIEALAAGLRFTGHGVAIGIEASPLERLRVGIAQSWMERLTPQDRQRFRPHVTVQNKVTPERAQRTYDALQSVFEPWRFVIEGLELWHYRGGPWERAATFPFGGAPG
ncbi:MAG: 2'-5' RNA ligase family protein [Beijerinckiaceae bacterium]|nr:2'-5' RNA ligase family protein [Beijerinckiaceae bacterium]MBX9758583.1 2'-5' RNA ligase family protein [Beijerinckiaceae bacterium]